VRRHVVDHAVAEADLPLVRGVKAGEKPQQRGLAAPRGAEEGEHLALLDGETDLADRRQGPEALGEILDRDAHGRAGVRAVYFLFSSSATDSISLRNCVLTAS
jgi:hypothetical protein